MSVVIQSSLTLSEAMTKEGRCSVVAGNGSLIFRSYFGDRFLDFRSTYRTPERVMAF